jgi:hypothetical protein
LQRNNHHLIALVLTALLVGSSLLSPLIYAANLTKQAFIQLSLQPSQADPKSVTTKQTLWLDDELQAKIHSILDHNYPKLRLKYWQNQYNLNDQLHFQTLWFLEEIGKEKPISFAVSVINDRVSLIRVLKFRESRGGEIQMLSFSEQFYQLGLNQDNQLDQNIDGITGATMSVSAMKKITRLALMLHQEVKPK